MIRYKQSKDERIPMQGVILAYGNTDYSKEKMFIINSNPIVLIKKDYSGPLVPTDLIGEEVDFIPTEINEEINLVIGSFKEAEEITGKNVLDRDKITVDSAVITHMFEWGCFLLVNDSYIGRLLNKDYFTDSNDNTDDTFRGGRLMSVFSVGDRIDNLECIQNKNQNVLDMYLKEKVYISTLEEYPLNDISQVEDDMVIECAVRDVFPSQCYVKIAPNIDALCGIPEYLDLDRDIMPEDIVKVKLKIVKQRVRGKIIEVVKLSDFTYEAEEGDFNEK